MAGAIDTMVLEKKIGKKYAGKVQNNFLRSIEMKTFIRSKESLALKSVAKPVFKDGLLSRITIFTPYYIYPILNYGFEGAKGKSFNYRVKARNFLADAVENGKLVEELGTEIGENRANKILARINFGFDEDLKTSNSLSNE